jgi:hypothetical protein
MSTALIGLAGVIVGGIVSGGIALVLARREDVQHRRASARLVLTEIAEFRFAISEVRRLAEAAKKVAKEDAEGLAPTDDLERLVRMIRPDTWRAAVDELDQLAQPLWAEHRPLLARYLPDPAWIAVANAYETVFPRAKTAATRIRVQSLSEVRYMDWTERSLAKALYDTDTAANALGSHAYDGYGEFHTPGAANVDTQLIRRRVKRPPRAQRGRGGEPGA